MSLDLQSSPVNEILHVAFNQDFTCFACGTESGFRVYTADPFKLTWSRDFEAGPEASSEVSCGLGLVSMLHRTNVLAIVGGGKRPRLPPHKVVLWDDRQAQTIAELSFRSAVRAVRLRRELIVVALTNKVFVYGLHSLVLLDQVETQSNPKGLICLSTGADRIVLVCPGEAQGETAVICYPKSLGEAQAPMPRESTHVVKAHESPLAAMAIDVNGTLLASASDKGTILRIYDTETGERKQELRRGADRAAIHSIVFSPSGEYLAVSSDKGTIHVFVVSHAAASGGASNATSAFQRISRVLPAYFSSEWSFAQFRVADVRCIAAFGADPHTIVVVCANGSYYKARFDPAVGGDMVREEFIKFDNASLEEHAAGSVCTSPLTTPPPAASLLSAAPADDEAAGGQGGGPSGAARRRLEA